MASLTGTKIKDTYDSLIKVSDNGALDGTLQTLTDGLGNDSALSLSTAGASVTGTLAVSGNAAFDTNTLFVDASNNRVGIGTSSPTDKFYILENSAAPAAFTIANNEGSFRVVVNNADTFLDADEFIFRNSAETERMRINSSGYVGIGEQTPLVPLHISRNTASGENIALILDNNDTTANSEVGLLFRSAVGSTNTDFQIATINTAANQAQLVFRSDGGTERMRIDSSGNVDINGGGYLRVSPTTPPAVQIYRNANLGNNASAGILAFGGKDTSVFAEGASIGATTEGVWSTTSHPTRMYFSTTPSGSATSVERMRITSGGAVLQGYTSVIFGGFGNENFSGLHYSGGTTGGFVAINSDTANAPLYISRTASSPTGTAINFSSNGTGVGTISITGSATAYNTSSDYRLKEDWQPMEGALDRVDALKPVNFAWKVSGDRVDGFLAHELAEVIPEAVTGEKDATEIRSVEVSPAVYEDVIHPAEEAVYETIEHPAIAEELDEEGNVLVEAQDAWTEEVLVSEAKEEWVEKVLVSEAVFEDQEFPVYQGIDQSKVVPLLVAGLQEAHDLIKSLQARIEALEG